MSAALAIGFVGLLALSGPARGSLARFERNDPSVRQLRRRAQADLDSGFCGDADDPYLYHVAPVDVLEDIAAEGLRPDATPPGFIGFQSWSKGKVFLSAGVDAMEEWRRILKQSQKRSWSSIGWVPIRIDLSSLAYKMIRSDWRSEVPCSFFVTRPIIPSHLQVQDSGGSWVTLTPEVATLIRSSFKSRKTRKGSRSDGVFLDENSKTRTQAVPNQSFTRSAVLSPAEASRKALSELRSMGGGYRPPEALDALRAVTAGHKKVLWIDMVKVNREAKGRGLGAAAADRVEAWGVEQGATLALAVSYDFTDTGSPLHFWEKLGYSSIYEDEDVAGQPAIIFKGLKNG